MRTIGLALLLSVLPFLVSAEPLRSADQVKAAIAKRYNVDVLGVAQIQVDGMPAWSVTVMEPAGQGSASFMVSTLVVSAETGELVPQFQHGTSGYIVSAPPTANPTTTRTGSSLRRTD